MLTELLSKPIKCSSSYCFQAILRIRHRHTLQARRHPMLGLRRHHGLRGHSVHQEWQGVV